MKELRGRNNCYYCGEIINWRAITNVQNFEFFSLEGNNAEAIAIGTINGSDGRLTEFEIIVTCPSCRVKNKFKVAK